jgi:hypothetical protein
MTKEVGQRPQSCTSKPIPLEDTFGTSVLESDYLPVGSQRRCPSL